MSVMQLDGPWRRDVHRESKKLTMGLLLGEVCSAMHVSVMSATVPLHGLLQLVTERTRGRHPGDSHQGSEQPDTLVADRRSSYFYFFSNLNYFRWGTARINSRPCPSFLSVDFYLSAYHSHFKLNTSFLMPAFASFAFKGLSGSSLIPLGSYSIPKFPSK